MRLRTAPVSYAGWEVRIMVKPLVRPEGWSNDDNDPAAGAASQHSS